MPAPEPPTTEVTRLLQEWSGGNQDALPRLVECVYGELRRIASNHLRRERRDHTLAPTALVNELYLRLVDQDRADWRNRSQFYAVASRMMRRLLIDYARERRAQKRQGILVSLQEGAAVVAPRSVDLVALDEALSRLHKDYPRESQVVELRYFGGMTLEEIAQCLSVSLATAKRDWKFAKGWLLRELSRTGDRDQGSS